jgi:hypothetical protein
MSVCHEWTLCLTGDYAVSYIDGPCSHSLADTTSKAAMAAFEKMDSNGDGKIERAMKQKRYEMRKKM